MNPILKRTLTGLVVGAAVVAAVLTAPRAVIAPAVFLVALAASVEYFLLLKRKVVFPSAAFFLSFAAGVVLLFAALGALPFIASIDSDRFVGPVCRGNLMLLYVIAVVKFSDVGGFAFGIASAKLMKGGNHKLCPSVSPNKSVEGLVGSVIFSCAVSLMFSGVTLFSPLKSLAVGAVAATVGTAGDLVESKFKRYVGVKDSSAMKITNGMGGVLDMLDSLLIAPAVLVLFL